MCRFVILLFAVVTPALAQPSAADSAWVDRLVRALSPPDVSPDRLALEDVTGLPPNALTFRDGTFAGPYGVITPAAADSVREAVFEGVRPDLVRDAVAVLEGSAYRRVVRVGIQWSQRAQAEGGFWSALDIEDTPLADSALAARYDAAVFAALNPRDLRLEAYEAMMADVSPPIREALNAMGLKDVLSGAPDSGASVRSVRAARHQLADVAPHDLEVVADFFESEAGLKVGRAVAQGTFRTALPESLELMRRVSRDTEALRERIGREGGTRIPADSLSLRDSPPGVRAEIVGVPVPAGAAIYDNIERVRTAVVYPEGARAEGVEGDVTVRVVLDAAGTVLEAEVIHSPDARLSRAVLEAVKAVTFLPPDRLTPDGRAPITFPVPFRLDG